MGSMLRSSCDFPHRLSPFSYLGEVTSCCFNQFVEKGHRVPNFSIQWLTRRDADVLSDVFRK